MRKLEIERGAPSWGIATSSENKPLLMLTEDEGVSIFIEGMLRFTVSFTEGSTKVALHGSDGPMGWITTSEDDSEDDKEGTP